MSSAAGDRFLRLSDGRRLAYAEYGDAAGRPVLLVHGIPGCRLSGAYADQAANKLGLRIIAPDRPGYGLSDFKPNPSLVGWPKDVLELANHLKFERFAIAGWSGGAPHVLACAATLPDRINAAAIVSGLAPPGESVVRMALSRRHRVVFESFRNGSRPANAALWVGSRVVRRFPDLLLKLISRHPSDRILLARPDVREMYRRTVSEAFRPGARGVASDFALTAHPWPFRLEEITTDVWLWHGEVDGTTPVAMGRYLAATIPGCRATFYPEEGHYLLINHMEEILGSLA